MKNLFALVLGVAASSGFAFTLNQGGNSSITNTGWQTGTVTFDIDVSCNNYRTTVESAINAAAGLWGTVPSSSLNIALGQTVTLSKAITTYVGAAATEYAPVGNPIVYCDAAFSTTSPSLDKDSIPGFATGSNLTSDGRIQGALLVLNVESGAKANITTLDETLVHVILTHEIGHCLGFGHSADTNAMMYYATGAGRQMVLAKDDIDAVTYLYPRKDLSSKGFGCTPGLIDSHNRKGPPSGFFGGGFSDFAFWIGIFASYWIWTKRRQVAFAVSV